MGGCVIAKAPPPPLPYLKWRGCQLPRSSELANYIGSDFDGLSGRRPLFPAPSAPHAAFVRSTLFSRRLVIAGAAPGCPGGEGVGFPPAVRTGARPLLAACMSELHNAVEILRDRLFFSCVRDLTGLRQGRKGPSRSGGAPRRAAPSRPSARDGLSSALGHRRSPQTRPLAPARSDRSPRAARPFASTMSSYMSHFSRTSAH